MAPEPEQRISRPPAPDGLLLPNLFQVESRRRETPDTFTLTLTPAENGGRWPFAPGQFNMLTAFGIGEVPISISGDPARPQTLIHTIRSVGAATRTLCGLRRGDTLGVRGPFGTAWPVAAAEGHDLVIVAGGLGLAPVRPAIYHALAHRAAYGNVEIVYGARTPGDILYYHELEGWRGRFDVRVHVTVDSAAADWRGRVGVVTKVMSQARFDPAHTTALVCGPGVMMRFTVQELMSRGVSADDIFVSMERNMQCGMGLCGHCQLGPVFVCKDGPVFPYSRIRDWFEMREV
jgi:NAD(P)H-flavin reductase|uniref:Ni/Fe hydrogenase subunit gamma n=1 Tax=Desulfobacca acetoxidans TaxID=60893 RepID=A0A7V6A292_9BACT